MTKNDAKAFIFAILIIFVFLNSTYAADSSDNVCQVTGRVKDALTFAPLLEANISFKKIDVGTSTKRDGTYEIYLPPGKYEIIISYIGYQAQIRKIVITKNTRHVVEDFALNPAVLSGQEITVMASSPEPKIARYEMNAGDMRRMPSPLPDVLLSLKTLPGVSSLNDQSSLYNVRGGNFDENLIYINGVEIYQPHLARKGVQENPSLINPYLVKKMNLRTGAFPVTYGDKLSSVLDVSYFEELPRSSMLVADVSTIGLNASYMKKISPNTVALVGFRKINYGYLFNALQTDGDYSPDFQDLQGLIKTSLSKKIHLTLFGLWAESQYEAEPTEWEYKNRNEGLYKSLFSGAELFDYTTQLVSARVDYQAHQKLKLEWWNSFSRQSENENTDLVETELYSMDVRKDPTENDYDDKTTKLKKVDSSFDTENYSSRLTMLWNMSTLLQCKAGFEVKYFDIKDRLFESESEENISGAIYVNPYRNYQLDSNRSGTVLGRYVQSDWSLSRDFILQTGIRWTTSSLNDEQLVLPRMQAIWYVSDLSELLFAAGKYAQPPIYKEFQFREGDDSDLLAQKSTQVTLGYKRILREDLSLKVEAFYKKLTDLISYDVNDVQIRYSGENDAKGYAYGFDAHLRGRFLTGTENWISYSYLKAREDILNDNVGYVPRPSDRRHLLAVYMEDRMDRYPNSRFHIRFVYGSGYPFTWQQWVYNDDSKSYGLFKGQRNALRLQFYSRFDAGFTQEFKRGENFRITFRQEVLNVFNHHNVLGYSLAFNRKVDQALSGRIFNIGMQVEF